MDITVFYAWQSDRPEKVNRYLIRGAAQIACKRITDENEWRVTLDSDTQGAPGMCDIPNTILEKIRNCDIFLADLTLVGRTESEPPKLLPNANVVFELGYAARQLGFKALVGVVNEAFGKVEGQVFDIKRRACLKYKAEAAAGKSELIKATNKLSKDLEKIIRGMIQTIVIPKRNKLKMTVEALDPRREERRVKARARQEKQVTAFRGTLEKEFDGLVKEYFANRNAAGQAALSTPAFWECVIQPSSAPDEPLINSIAACRTLVSQCQVGPSASPLPDTSHSIIGTGQDWVGGRLNNYGLECWRLSQEPVFAMILSTQEDAMQQSTLPCIGLNDMLLRLTQVFRFSARLAGRTFADGEVDVFVRLGAINGRPLVIDGSFGRFQYSTSDRELCNTWHCTQEELKNPDLLAVKAAYWFCERFNWQYVNEESLINLQRRFLSQL